ncbi:MAG: CPBP family intramembrane glutamic endopeptidase [Roseimicrobium sp.]
MLFWILGYVALVLLLGAALAPGLFFATRAMVEQWPENPLSQVLEDKEFPSYFNRAALLVAVAGLFPLLRALRLPWGEVLGEERATTGWRNLLVGFVLAVVFVAVMGWACWWVGASKLLPEDRRTGDWLNPVMPLVSGFAVGVVEEFLFRGAVLGILVRTLGARSGLAWSTGIFALVHFLKPPLEGELNAEAVTWSSGFWVVSQLFRGFGQWQNVTAEFLLLVAVGWVLARARLATGGLWASIGLHAGWVAGMKYFGQMTLVTHALRDDGFAPWMVRNTCRAIVSPVVGLVPLATVLLTGVLALALLQRRTLAEGQKAIASAPE